MHESKEWSSATRGSKYTPLNWQRLQRLLINFPITSNLTMKVIKKKKKFIASIKTLKDLFLKFTEHPKIFPQQNQNYDQS